MKFWVILATLSCALVVSNGKPFGSFIFGLGEGSCKSAKQCAEGQCCAGFWPFGGTCSDMSGIGARCHVKKEDEYIVPGIARAMCPCEKGLECIPKGKKGKGFCDIPPPPPTTEPAVPPTEAKPVEDKSSSETVETGEDSSSKGEATGDGSSGGDESTGEASSGGDGSGGEGSSGEASSDGNALSGNDSSSGDEQSGGDGQTGGGEETGGDGGDEAAG